MKKKQSPSSIICFERCKREYYYRYILNLPIKPSIHLVKGNVVHYSLELFYNKYYDNLNDYMETCFEQSLVKYKKDIEELDLTEEQYQTEKQDMFNILDLYLRLVHIKLSYYVSSGKASSLSHAFHYIKPKFKELWLEDEGMNLCGKIDRVMEDYSGRVTITDYKTSNRYGTEIRDEYELQGALYALLFKLTRNIVPHRFIVSYLRFGIEYGTRITPTLIEEAISVVNRVNEHTENTDISFYPKTEGKFCEHCSYFEECSGISKAKSDIRKKKVLEELGKTTVTPVQSS